MPYSRPWTWAELQTMWEHPDWTAKELEELLPGRTVRAIRSQRERYGRYNAGMKPKCCICEARPVWQDSPQAKKYGLCKGCYLEERELQLKEEAYSARLRQQQRRLNRKKGERNEKDRH